MKAITKPEEKEELLEIIDNLISGHQKNREKLTCDSQNFNVKIYEVNARITKIEIVDKRKSE